MNQYTLVKGTPLSTMDTIPERFPEELDVAVEPNVTDISLITRADGAFAAL